MKRTCGEVQKWRSCGAFETNILVRQQSVSHWSHLRFMWRVWNHFETRLKRQYDLTNQNPVSALLSCLTWDLIETWLRLTWNEFETRKSSQWEARSNLVAFALCRSASVDQLKKFPTILRFWCELNFSFIFVLNFISFLLFFF